MIKLIEYVTPEFAELVGDIDYYYYEYPLWESPYAVNYNASQRNWFISHGVRLHYVTNEDIKKLGLIKVIE